MSRIDLAQALYEGFAVGDREAVERLLADGFHFSAPPDPLLDRDGFFERCWPGAGTHLPFDFKRLIDTRHADLLADLRRLNLQLPAPLMTPAPRNTVILFFLSRKSMPRVLPSTASCLNTIICFRSTPILPVPMPILANA